MGTCQSLLQQLQRDYEHNMRKVAVDFVLNSGKPRPRPSKANEVGRRMTVLYLKRELECIHFSKHQVLIILKKMSSMHSYISVSQSLSLCVIFSVPFSYVLRKFFPTEGIKSSGTGVMGTLQELHQKESSLAEWMHAGDPGDVVSGIQVREWLQGIRGRTGEEG